MSKMTMRYAKILAGMLPTEVAAVLRGFGTVNIQGIAESTVDYLKEFNLIQQTKNLLTGELIWTLTDAGKKVQKYL